MASVLRFVSPKIGRLFNPTATDLIDQVFGTTPSPVSVEIYPCQGATSVSNATLTINGSTRNFTTSSGQNPLALTFNLGGDTIEIAGGANTITITALDNGSWGATTFNVSYYRLASATTTTTTTTSTTTTSTTTTPAPGKPVRKRAPRKA